MAKPPVLGNDPFQRGAADRQQPAAAAPAEKKPRARAASKAPAAAPAKKQKVASKRAAEPKKSRTQRAAAKPAAPASKPAKAASRTQERPVAKKTGRRQPGFKPTPLRAVPRPVEPQPETPPVVLQGEVVHSIPARPAPPREETPYEFTPEPPPRVQLGLFERLRHAARQAADSAVDRALDSAIGQRVIGSLGSSTLAQKVMARTAVAAMSAAPRLQAAVRLLPPAVGAARHAMAVVMSGDAARELISTAAEAGDAARRVITRVEPDTYDFDDFGEDPALNSRLEPFFDFLHDRYFRVETFGTENVPAGACILVCNHSGALPLDGPMVKTALRKECRRNDARWLVEDAIYHAPFLGVFLNRIGAVRACPDNAQRLLAQGVAVSVFPEGILGTGKRIDRRYQLQRFGRGGFVKLAMRTGVPIVPVAIVGAEEATPLLGKIPASMLGVPYVPVTLPLPLPTKWTISFLPPVDVSAHGAAGAEDLALVADYTARVREAIQNELNGRLEQRTSLFS